MGRPQLAVILAGLIALLAVGADGADFFVAPEVGPRGDGSIARPWSLAHALTHPPVLHPGDTIWLRGGTYRGKYVSYLTGTTTAPILLKSYPGEWARIDGGAGSPSGLAILQVYGAYAWYWGFEIMSSDPLRTTTQAGSSSSDINRGACVATADGSGVGTKLINLVCHDAANGFELWMDSSNLEAYGNIIFNNGWVAPDRGHGHGIYAQNLAGSKFITDNIVLNSYDINVQIYGSSAAPLNNIEVTGNTFFGAGAPSGRGLTYNLLFGGGSVAYNGKVRRNYIYHPTQVTSANLGYGSGLNTFEIKDNWFTGEYSLQLDGSMSNVTITGNRFFDVTSPNLGPSNYPQNTYYDFVRPTGTFVYVRPNAYEPGRANITVFNWDRNSTVAVDVSGVLPAGASYEVRNAQNFFGPPVLSGVYTGGPLTLPMAGLPVATPIGGALTPSSTGPEFNAFVVITRTERRLVQTPDRRVPNSPPPLQRTPRAQQEK